jgi:hypothetical protein
MEWRSIDTFNDEYSQKAQGEINTIPFYFSLDEQKKLIEEINRVDFMNLPDTLILKDSLKDTLESINFILPVLECEIEYNGQLKKVFCGENGNIRSSNEYMRLQAVLIKINEIIQGRPEVRELPYDIYY